jgi:hypothetical protein
MGIRPAFRESVPYTGPEALQSCLILPVVLLFCGTFFILIERPCMHRDWPKTLWQRTQSLMLSPARQSPS